ncbi:ABC-type molybdate transport system, periplasmic component [Desulfosporosinus acidiphilus SJ4]|uniref:ABC-type molybdate transport system, periplasmic component n=1 Tax=Desulfosporosinus acidiphilus (strain DSM 22704 / JCM 16185 / SJ4) TaxID=646529 RepID=I4D1F5_DESAJ|nr:extracellular solute-binding protein [Desulfosporosinus acidiphilus]AFM39629.1 ABC-type molybdate transport system, periplasmic component [Desulfosporosinus acidiphilus SJ4]
MVQKTLKIIHAGALQHVMEKCQEYFSQYNQGLRIEMEGVGSREGAKRLLSGEKFDIVALADQALFTELLVPNLIKNYFVFATDQIVIGCHHTSIENKEITSENWVDVLLKPQVNFARSDHRLDPCGYRTLMVWQLAERFYNRAGLYSTMEAACIPYTIYPKSLDLSRALLKGKVDYAFLYSSEVIQLGLPYIVLPPKINLSNPAYAKFYDQASVSLESKIPGTNIIIHGSPIEFAIGIAKDSSQPDISQSFVDFLTGQEGSSILEECGLIPC